MQAVEQRVHRARIIPEPLGRERPHDADMPCIESRFAIAWLLPLGGAAAAWASPWAAWAYMLAFVGLVALLERVPLLGRSPPPSRHTGWHRACLLLHGPLQLGLLALGVVVAAAQPADALGAMAVVALGLGVGGVTGSQGITFAHELGHSKRRLDRATAWLLMGSVLYAHFMVEHYRGHHPRAATHDDPASARRGESLWRFLPRTLAGSWASAWRLEAARLRQHRRGWGRSPLLAAMAVQALVLAALAAAFGPWALLFWVVQAAQAVLLLETINYIEHYGLQRRQGAGGRAEPFGVAHAWNADHWVTNAIIANLQRHSDHHMHAWKPFGELQALPGPQLPTGYAGCLVLASVPRWWFALMEPRLARLEAATGATPPPAP
jgi:alkane 1-monooxygenase